MKKLITCIALFGLVGLTACSGDSPSAPPAPTVVPTDWQVTELSVSDSTPFIDSVITVQAVVSKNGSAAPDGTSVEFSATGGNFLAAKASTVNVTTTDGSAAVQYVASDAGTYGIQARVADANRQTSVTYQEHTADDRLEIYQPLIPNVGSFDGGETVIMNGKGIAAPVDVTFTVDGVVYPAIVQNVVESVPLSEPGSITVLTPYISAADRTRDWLADVAVTGGSGTANAQTVTLPSAFTFLTDVPLPAGPPMIYAIHPNFGQAAGGDQVTILGRNFDEGSAVVFNFQGQELTAEVLSVSEDGLQILAVTPQFSLAPLENDTTADLKVTTAGGEDLLPQAFLVLASEPQPEITSIAPVAGPLDGGTLVTIFGHGFQNPAQVFFGDLEAEQVQVFDDPTPADNDRITCLSPDYSQQNVTPPARVLIELLNVESGKFALFDGFIYGDNLFISGNTPTEGRPGDSVIVFGSGFEDPLQLFFQSNDLELDVMNVSGTEILARFPADLPASCSDASADFKVVLIESNIDTTGGLYRLLGNQPTVTSVDPTFVQETNGGNGVDPDDVMIYGGDFADDLLVTIGSFVMASANVTVLDENSIAVANIPAPNDFGLNFNRMPCTTNDGLQGDRLAATPVEVTVTNIPGGSGCADTLQGGIIYEPEDTSCVARSWIQTNAPLVFPPADAPACTNTDLVISNTGGGDLQVYQLNLTDRFYFDGGASSQVDPGFIVAPFDSVNVPIYFCPDVDNGSTYQGNLAIQHSAGNQPNPWQIALTAQEAFPYWVVSPMSFVFGGQTAGGGPYAHGTPLTITNTGLGTLTWSLTVTGNDPNFFWILEGASGSVPPLSSANYTVMFNPTQVVPYSAEFYFTAGEVDAQPMMVIGPIQVSGNGI